MNGMVLCPKDGGDDSIAKMALGFNAITTNF
jgi:hypothetical protein